MKPWHKTALRSAGVLVLVLVTAAVALRILVEPERLKSVARDKAQAAYSRDLAMGSLEFGFWPVPWLEATDVSFSNAKWASERHLFQARRITAHLALWPLLSGNVKLRSLAVEGGKAVIETSRDGKSNWELHRGAEAAHAAVSASPTEGLLELRRLTFEDFDIDDRRVHDQPRLWHVKEATLRMVPVLRDVRIEASVTRNGHPLEVRAALDDFSHFGETGATTPGRIEFDWGGAKLTLAGHMPLEPKLEGHRIHGDLVAPALGDVLAFFDLKRRPRAPFEAHFDAVGARDAIRLEPLAMTLGALHVDGTADLRFGGDKPVIDAKLSANDVEWSKALLDAGGEVHGKLPAGEVLPDTPLGWGMLVALQGKKGSIDARIGRVKLGNGLEMRNVKTRLDFDDDRLEVPAFAADMLGGSATAKLRMEGRTRRAHLDFDGRNLLLERWFHERGRRIPFEGGPMQVRASLDSRGESMKRLAAAMTGTATIRMGSGVFVSARAEEAEAKMAAAFEREQKAGIRFQCVGAMMPFRNGRAESVIGATSDVSRLLTHGVIDFRDQTFDLRGRLKPRSGAGLATVAGDVKLFGTMAKPQISLDHPAALARLGAAIASIGISAAATAISDAANTDDPCEAALAKPETSAQHVGVTAHR
ncbi:MAG: AsmA family protein [Betaproteobacteria bacterium]